MVVRRFWILLGERRIRGSRVFVFGPDGGGTLPVFGFWEEAEMFLRLGAPGTDDWTLKRVTAGEVAFLLRGMRNVRKVALDPPPEVCGCELVDLVSISRERFLRTFAGGRSDADERSGFLPWASAAGRRTEGAP